MWKKPQKPFSLSSLLRNDNLAQIENPTILNDLLDFAYFRNEKNKGCKYA